MCCCFCNTAPQTTRLAWISSVYVVYQHVWQDAMIRRQPKRIRRPESRIRFASRLRPHGVPESHVRPLRDKSNVVLLCRSIVNAPNLLSLSYGIPPDDAVPCQKKFPGPDHIVLDSRPPVVTPTEALATVSLLWL
jgi:hypothetical protein